MSTTTEPHPAAARHKWVAAGPGLASAARIASLARAPSEETRRQGWFRGAPTTLTVVDEGTRRLAQTCILRAFEALRTQHGCELHSVDLLLVFASRYATLQTRGLIDRVDDPSARLNPRISTDMETSEPVRGAIAELGSGAPRGALVIASEYDEHVVSQLAPAGKHVMVLRLEVWPGSDDPKQTDVLASCSFADVATGSTDGGA